MTVLCQKFSDVLSKDTDGGTWTIGAAFGAKSEVIDDKSLILGIWVMNYSF
jgi:hypothetical protein